MRRSRKEIRDSQVVEGLLGSALVGRLGTVGEDGAPRVKPLNFAWHAGRVYFHSAERGRRSATSCATAACASRWIRRWRW